MDTTGHHIHLLHIALWAFIVIAIGNFVWLDMHSLQNLAQNKQNKTVASMQNPLSEKPAVTSGNVAVFSLSPTSVPITQITYIQTGAKEFFVPFGAGMNNTDDWVDVGALQATIDSSQYGKIKQALFEASVRIPTGNEKAYVRLFNITDKHPVWFSEVSMEGGTPQLIVSQPVVLDSGVKTYQVQMKTSLKSEAILDQARLHIMVY